MAGIYKAYDVRGTYPDQVNETVAFRIGYHFRDLLDAEDLARGPKVVVSRDMRSHSEPLVAALKAGLRARGVAVVDVGLADTPQNYFAIGFLGASGGIQVTASHNPAVYNGFKMSRRDAIPVSSETGIAELERLVTASAVTTDLPPRAGEERREVTASYHAHVLSFLESREPRLKLAADAANGMGTLYRPVLEALNLELAPLYFELDGTFPNHEANPLKPENLVDVQRAVREHGCDLGLPSTATPTGPCWWTRPGRSSPPTWSRRCSRRATCGGSRGRQSSTTCAPPGPPPRRSGRPAAGRCGSGSATPS